MVIAMSRIETGILNSIFIGASLPAQYQQIWDIHKDVYLKESQEEVHQPKVNDQFSAIIVARRAVSIEIIHNISDLLLLTSIMLNLHYHHRHLLGSRKPKGSKQMFRMRMLKNSKGCALSICMWVLEQFQGTNNI